MAFRSGILIVALAAGVASAACGDRLRVVHHVHVAVSLPAHRAIPEIEAAMDPAILARVGGALPALWPEEEAPVVIEAPFDAGVLIERLDLEAMARDLDRAGAGEVELRVRAVAWSLDPRDLNHPVVDLVLWVGGADAERPGAEGTRPVGHLDDPPAGEGRVVFAPGGRRALGDAFLDGDFVLFVEAIVRFDTDLEPARPAGSARVDLTLHVDVLH